jgi:cytochrome c oxidase subunit II
MTGLLITAMVVLIFVVLYQVGQASELSAILKEEERTNKTRNLWMAWAMLLTFPVLMYFFWYVHTTMMPQMLPDSASDHGIQYEFMFKWTTIICGIVFVLTQFVLFWFSYKYRASDNRSAFFFAHSNKLEIIWTSVPAIAMAVLVAIGLKNWFAMTGDAPKIHQTVEVIGKQFNWIMRYPGPDGKLGKRDYRLINDANNVLGLDWKDPATHDDIIANELHLTKGTPVEIVIGSRDVIHDLGLPHFRMKMDAVPGVPTRMWFTPIISTEEMKEKTNNPNFVYEISCDQMCGRGHYSMKGTVIVHDTADYKVWEAGQKSYYVQNSPDAPKEAAPAAAPSTGKPADSNAAKKITMITK